MESEIDHTTSRKAAAVAVRILKKWGCGPDQLSTILDIESRQLDALESEPEGVVLSCDQAIRVSLILNIHAALRQAFENPDNIYGYMTSPNHNSANAGATPLKVIEGGSLNHLYRVYGQIESLLRPM